MVVLVKSFRQPLQFCGPLDWDSPLKLLLFFSRAFVIKEWCFPMLTEVLSTPKDIQLSHDSSFCTKTLSMDVNMPSAVEEVDKNMSKNWVMTLCWLMSRSLTVTGFILLRPWSLLPSVLILKSHRLELVLFEALYLHISPRQLTGLIKCVELIETVCLHYLSAIFKDVTIVPINPCSH